MLDSIKKSGGMPSICSAHPAVLRTAFQTAAGREVLVESTCNQVNQFGGYTGMTPADFNSFVRGLARESGFPESRIILGGDHLGPGVWRNETSGPAMAKAKEMIRAYVRAGYTKLHLDCSQPLSDDPVPLNPVTATLRAAELAEAAEAEFSRSFPENGECPLRYVIGTEVPVPGGSLEGAEDIQVTRVDDAEETLEIHHMAFLQANLGNAWKKVIALVVQPGVEFGDDFVAAYQPEKTGALTSFIKSRGLVYEAHSTDYQNGAALADLVRGRFTILKVGPALTFAYREAVFALALMENELLPAEERSNLIETLDRAMEKRPGYWEKYYHGTAAEIAFKRKYSLSDRIRYYWADSDVQERLKVLIGNLSRISLPLTLVSQYAPREKDELLEQAKSLSPENIISARISFVLGRYWNACRPSQETLYIG